MLTHELLADAVLCHPGDFSFNVDLKPVGNVATPYEVLACFEDNVTIAKNCTAWSRTPDGLDYAACTTVQYGYKPASKSLSLKVTYQSTEVIDPDSPEELQKKVKDKNWLRDRHEFDWRHPWYRIHHGIFLGDTVIDIGFNPLLPGGETYQFSGLEFMTDVLEEFIDDFRLEVVLLFGEYIAAKILSFFPPTYGIAALIFALKLCTQGYMFATNAYDRTRMGAVALVNVLMALIACSAPLGAAFLAALNGLVYTGTMSALYLLFNGIVAVATPIQYVRSWIDGLEIGLDIAFAVAAWSIFKGMIS